MKRISAFFAVLLCLVAFSSCAKNSEFIYYNYDLSQYITLGKYLGAEVPLQSTEVTQQALENEINYWLDYYGHTFTKDVKGRDTVKNGDVVNIDYVGRIDGKEFDGGSETDRELEIGSGEFIEGFEENLIGAVRGRTIKFDVTFPKSTGDELSGKVAEFEVTVNSISEKVYEELTDKIVYDMTEGEYGSVRDFTAYVKRYLKDDIVTANSELVWDSVIDNCRIHGYPEAEIQEYINDTYNYYEKEAMSGELSLSEYLQSNHSMSMQEFNEQTEKNAHENIKREMAAFAIAKAEGIEISERKYKNGLDDYAEFYGYQSDDLEKEVGKEKIKKWILIQEVLELVTDNAVNISEKTTQAPSN